jgi:hypothetical protein
VSEPQLNTQALPMQVSPVPQTWPQTPQFALSVVVFAQ